ncbi:hypothetical protein KIH74_25465 [Kineosporia sp. J2-2]|uniref:Uncharacterized protein n=1 Tax=Kineosporia corallincola TaxID=2835133 RepID=A0ABS5TPM4_9ACTN|nr:hypothetical protein [Kineosporia corallincola]MBT0772319.1 hypothetical protein [Kineosporia corallincola]
MPNQQTTGGTDNPPRKSRAGMPCRTKAQLIEDIELLAYSDHLEGIARRLNIAPAYLRKVLRQAERLGLLEAITLRPVAGEDTAA